MATRFPYYQMIPKDITANLEFRKDLYSKAIQDEAARGRLGLFITMGR